MRRTIAVAGTAWVLVAGGGVVRAADPTPEERVATFVAAEGEAKKAAAEAIVAAKPKVEEVVAALSKGRAYAKDVEKGWLRKTQKGPDGRERPYLLYVPDTYDPAKRWRLVVEMHGGVARPLPTHEELEELKQSPAGMHAELEKYFLVVPAGEREAEWWTETGAGSVLGMVAATRRVYAIDENAMIATGFSDGGSGSYYLALAHSTPFAAFVPLNGHVGVAGLAGLDVHLENLRNKPMYAVNTDLDSLYPSAALKPIADALVAMKAPYTWREVKGFGHDPSYLVTEGEAIWTWEKAQKREPHPATLVWAGGAGAPSRVHGLANVAVVEGAGGTIVADANPLLPPGRLRLGINLDTAHAGKGLKVAGVTKESAAEAVGIRTGDLVVEFDGAEVESPQTFRKTLDGKKPGDAFRLKVKRGDATQELSGKFPEQKPEPAFRRAKPWGYVEAKRTGNTFAATTWNVASFELWLGAGTVDLAKPVVVTVNGKEVSNGPVAPDLRFLLERAAEDDDATMLYVARLAVKVPAPEKPATK